MAVGYLRRWRVAKPEAKDGEGVRTREEQSGGEAGAARSTGGVGAEGERFHTHTKH